jgi:hypothetical protein
MKRYLVALFLFGLSVSGFAHAQCAAFPCVVATVSLASQSQNIPSTPIFTPTSDGTFRISVYMSTSTGTIKRASWVAFVGWTDEHRVQEVGIASAAPNGWGSQSYVIREVAGQPMLYQTKLSAGGNGNGGMTYDLFFTVEQLQ